MASLWVNDSLPIGQRTLDLEFPVASISSSLLSLEVAADSLKFVQNYSPGKVSILVELWSSEADSHVSSIATLPVFSLWVKPRLKESLCLGTSSTQIIQTSSSRASDIVSEGLQLCQDSVRFCGGTQQCIHGND